MLPKATIVITTFNRCELLRQAIKAAQKQSVPTRIIVMDDASTDATSVMMAKEFPEIEYYCSTENKGPCYQRNRGIELANTEIVFPLDDDSILQSPYTVEQTLLEFNHIRVGAVAIPFINKLISEQIHTKAPDKNNIYLTHAFVAASHAVRRETFLKAGGYREFFFYMGEEGDVCIRMLQQKYFVRLGTADPIYHFQPPQRVSIKADMFGRQNDILFLHCNAPSNSLFYYLLGTSIKGILFGIKVGRLWNMLRGLAQGYSKALTYFNKRSPLDSDCFQLYRNLKKLECVPLKEVEYFFN
jgi:glycosyltransferase involved in cell wall biosynthesis